MVADFHHITGESGRKLVRLFSEIVAKTNFRSKSALILPRGLRVSQKGSIPVYERGEGATHTSSCTHLYVCALSHEPSMCGASTTTRTSSSIKIYVQ